MTNTYPSIEEMLYRYVFPVIIFRRLDNAGFQPIAAVGTGFTFGDGMFITCWHCVSGELDTDVVYGIPYGADMNFPDKALVLIDIQRACNGSDLAIARILIGTNHALRLGASPAPLGCDVVGLGFPHSENTINPSTNEPLIKTQSRALKGYVSAVGTHATGGVKEAKYYELGMRVPLWASGSPLMNANTLEIVGVLAGEWTSEIGDSSEFTMGLALHLDVLMEAIAGHS